MTLRHVLVYEEAFNVASANDDADKMEEVAAEWRSHLAGLRDTDAMVALALRCVDEPSWTENDFYDPAVTLAGDVWRGREEIVVVEQLARSAIDAFQRRGDKRRGGGRSSERF